MACPIPLRIINPKYKKIASDNKEPVENYDQRNDYYIDVPCGVCYNCRKSYKSMWRIRLNHEWHYLPKSAKANCYFITLTFSDKWLPSGSNVREVKSNTARLVRLFLERVRKKYKVSARHWIVSEYGGETSRLHLHGILFNPPFKEHELPLLWRYGFTDSKLLTPKRISYVTTYINKLMDSLIEDPAKRQFVLCSPGLGKSYATDRVTRATAHVNGAPSPFGYHGASPFALPRYYRKYIFDDDEREDMTQSYFMHYSEDVIPPPPYYIGTARFDDYSLYVEACKSLKHRYNQIYGKFSK